MHEIAFLEKIWVSSKAKSLYLEVGTPPYAFGIHRYLIGQHISAASSYNSLSLGSLWPGARVYDWGTNLLVGGMTVP